MRKRCPRQAHAQVPDASGVCPTFPMSAQPGACEAPGGVRVEFEIDREDFAEAVLAVAERRPIRRWQWVLLGSLAVAVLVLMGLITALTGNLSWLDDSPLFRPLLYALGVVLGLLFLVLALRAALRMWVRSRPRDDGSVLGWHAIELDEEGLREETRHGKSTVTWSGVLEVREAPNHVFLFVDRGQAHVIPVRAFASDQARQAFVDFARARSSERG